VNPTHKRILDCASAAAKATNSRDQIRRYGREFLAWCEDEGADFTSGTAIPVRDNYLVYLDAQGVFSNPKARQHRGWIVNRLIEAVGRIETRKSGPTVPLTARTRLVDGLVPDTKLDRLVQEMLDAASSPARRGVLRCDVGLFLAWCRDEDRDPATITVIELERYRAWIRARELKAEGRLVAARRIVMALNPPSVWW
jgi:hypothetical protein